MTICFGFVAQHCSIQGSRLLAELVYIELCHLDVLHFEIEEYRHLANGCTAKCACIWFDVISLSIICLGAIICDINAIGFVSVYVTLWLQIVQPFTRRLHCQ